MKIKLIPEMAFNPFLLATIVGTKKNRKRKIKGEFLKYIILILLAKYLRLNVDKNKKNTKNNIPTMIFKYLPPRYSEISKISFPLKVLKSLQIINVKRMAKTLTYMILIIELDPVERMIILGTFKTISFNIIINIRAIDSNLLIFSVIFINSFPKTSIVY